MNGRKTGFTLIELIMVIVIAGVLSTIVLSTLILPIHAFEDQSRRAELIYLADAALMHMSRDLRGAVPNSVRVARQGSVYSLEMLRSSAVGRYRFAEDPTNTNDSALSPGYPDSAFNVMGNIGSPVEHSRIVVNSENTNALYVAAVSGTAGIISPASTKITVMHAVETAGTEQRIVLSSPFQFDAENSRSPHKRFYVSDTAITYRCDPQLHEIRRYVNYSVSAEQTTVAPSGANSNLLVNSVTDCEFLHQAGTSKKLGLVTLMLTLSRTKSYSTSVERDDESIHLIQQVPVSEVYGYAL